MRVVAQQLKVIGARDKSLGLECLSSEISCECDDDDDDDDDDGVEPFLKVVVDGAN